MEKERKVKVLSLVALIVAVLGLTVAFAAMSTTLNINGTATLDAATWKVKFQNLGTPTLKGGATVTQAPTLTETKVGDFKVSLTKPGDSVTYTFDVTNSGTINASLSTFTKNAKPTCTSPSNVTADATLVCDNLTYTLTYDTETGTAVKQGDSLNVGQTKKLVLKLTYNQSATKLPSAKVDISGLGITLVYSQA